MYSFLLQEASKPYFEILRAWIKDGLLDDHYNEFMIEERSTLSKSHLRDDYNDVYWEQRYTIRSEWVPCFFESHKETILLAGKYLNVLRECGIEEGLSEAKTIVALNDIKIETTSKPDVTIEGYNESNFRLNIEIDKGYLEANRALLHLLFQNYNLMDRLKSIKNLFLLNQSDYLTHFIDVSVNELLKPSAKVSLTKLKSLLELVLRSPSTLASNDLYRDSFTVEISQMSLLDQLMRINSMVGIDMKKLRENILSGQSFKVSESLHSCHAAGLATALPSELIGKAIVI